MLRHPVRRRFEAFALHTLTRGTDHRARCSARRAAGGMRRRRTSWVQAVRETSNAMDLPRDLFTRTPEQVARGLRRAVLRSRRTKGTKFQSAMSMLNLYVNRAGRRLPARERVRLDRAKTELRRVFGRPSVRGRPARRRRPPREGRRKATPSAN